MKLYHGSKNIDLNKLVRMKAEAGEGVQVPEDETKEGVYLTRDYGYALAMAIRPEGVTQIDYDKKKIKFEDPEKFNPSLRVCVYEIEVDEKEARRIDKMQFIVENLAEIDIISKQEHLAIEIENYYELENWENPEKNQEFKLKIQ